MLGRVVPKSFVVAYALEDLASKSRDAATTGGAVKDKHYIESKADTAAVRKGNALTA